ncbi:MAG: murein biosynthesis integral membrane protein MurJ [Sutterellaceae bacterium]|nr:murein biosynthesis integral membrane protein MurJ [Burkholderiaceae bacterium]MDW8430517.1 murein biosynthesis integral membrane protein MurJ [Sutterellaceae bacterium]
MNLLRAAAAVAGLTLMSRITGLARDLLISRIFGVNAATDAFNVAFRIPNLLRRLFAEGAFQQAFVPILADVRARQGDAGTRLLVDRVTSALFWSLLLVSLLGVLAAPALVWLIATGLARDSSAFALATTMTRWMFPYILFMSLVALAAGVLNTFKRFAVPAATPVLLNLSFIAAALWAAPHFDPPILALAAAVVVGGALQLALQLPALAAIGMLPRLGGVLQAFRDPGVHRILRLMLPAVLAVSVAQLSIIINTNIASRLSTGSVTWLAFADRLMEFPTALLGVALGTVLLPNLSAAYAENRLADYRRLLDWGLRLTLLLALPAALGLGLLAEGLVAVLFQGGRFTWLDVQQTARALVGYAVGLVGLIAVKILAPGFYARQDVKTPVRIAVGVLIATQLANLVLVPWLAHAGLAVSVGLGACANAAFLFVGLRRAGLYEPLPGWRLFLLKLLAALAVLALTLLAANVWIDWQVLASRWVLRAALLAAAIAAAMAAYFGTLWLLGLRPRDLILRG